ncbi:MAG TPA: hypothetical protein VGD84_04980 [Pseudonocardiaceae bacterium]
MNEGVLAPVPPLPPMRWLADEIVACLVGQVEANESGVVGITAPNE